MIRNKNQNLAKNVIHQRGYNGISRSIKIDNDLQFVLQKFGVYYNENNIERRRSIPLWPQADGER